MDLMPMRGKRSGEHPLSRVRDEIDDVFDRFFRDPFGTSLGLLNQTASFPRLDLSETDNEVTVRAELPGVRPEDVNLEVTGNVLRISGQKSEEHEEMSRDFRYSERQYGSFARTIQLPTGVDANNVDATYKDGVLCIRMPKHPEAQPKRIEVRAGGSTQPAKQVTSQPAQKTEPPAKK